MHWASKECNASRLNACLSTECRVSKIIAHYIPAKFNLNFNPALVLEVGYEVATFGRLIT